MPLADGHLDLWCVRSDAADVVALLDRYRRLLTPDELARGQRFLFEKDRNQFLVTRALVRTVLSHYTGDDPRCWRFATNSHGRPSAIEPAGVSPQFNISHTAGMVVCAVVAAGEVGVDVEDLGRLRVNLDLARRFFATAEVEALQRVPASQQPATFLEFWTLKESYIKARGLGLSIPLHDFAFTLAAEQPATISFSGSCVDRAEPWQFAQIRLGDRHHVAVALRPPGSPRLTIGEEPAGGLSQFSFDENGTVPFGSATDAPSPRLTIRLRETIPLGPSDEGRLLPPCPANRWLL